MCSDQLAVFCSSLIWRFPVFCSGIFQTIFQLVPVAPVITGMAFVFIFHMFCVSLVRPLCLRIFSSSFIITFLSPETARSNRIHVPACLITDYGIWFIVMDGILCLHSSFHNMFTLPSFQNMFTIISRKRRCKTDEATNLI